MRTQKYAEPVRYWLRNENEIAKLQREAGELRDTVESKKACWVERTRAEARLKTVERELQLARVVKRQAEQAQQRTTVPLVRSDDGQSFLVQHTRREPPEFMEPVAYFAEEPKRQEGRFVSNASQQQRWPEKFSERHALVEAAIAELRRSGAA